MSDVNLYISQDIWFEILKNLPVKTLGKYRCVCKSWHSLIVSPSFMTAHLKHYTRNDANSVILYNEIVKNSESREFEQISLFRDLDMLKQGNILHTSTCPLILPRISFVGSVNGLVCVSERNYFGPKDHILIWNPIIKKSIKLPKSTFRGRYSVVGFGYDCNTNDYRVIKISHLDENTPFVEVYSVQERTWKAICAKYLVDNPITIVSFSSCFCNGVIHWHIVNEKVGMSSSNRECLLLFNVAEERFARTKLPEKIENSSGSDDFGIFEYHGMLSVSLCDYMLFDRNTSAKCQIWVKRDYNVESSWCKILNVCMYYGYTHNGPVEYLGPNKELIAFAKESTGQMVSYDPKTYKITELGLRVSETTKFSAFSESLALLDQNNYNLIVQSLIVA
ncbi:F-box/kelch-repeat protein At3g06240-like [Silene latifolia]|uniref:F-box/kelch-repeat protein At3g06240-like n=1 Tax=Silene latifolia TaxID=37657 RepID=UPI003D780D22